MKLIKNCNLINMAGISREKMDILIENGKIKEISSSISSENIPSDEIYDAKNNIVTPGFVEAHCNVGVINQIYRFEGNDGNEVSGPLLPNLRALDAIDITDEGFNMALSGGVTTVIASPGNQNVIGGTCTAIKTSGKSFDSRVLEKEVAFYFDLSNGPRKIYGSKDMLPKTRMGSSALLREALYHAKEYKMAKDQGDKVKFDMKMESLQRVFEGMLIKIHAEHYTDIVTASNICDEFDIKAIIVGCCDLLEALPSINLSRLTFLYGSALVTSFSHEHRNICPKMAGKLQNEGIEFAVITAHPAYNIEYVNVQLAYLQKRGMKNPLEAVTIIPAKIMGISDRVGSLEKGKDADIVIWDKEPLDFYASAIDVFVDGLKANRL